MTSTIKVDNIQNQCGANIINESSNTITLGASGDTVTLASGASQSGFGRTGTVDWDTTAKTAAFTAVSGNGYFVNTTSAAITVTLPASPSAGDIVAVADYANTFSTNALTVARNGSLINGAAFDYETETDGISLTFVYVDGTRGWKNVNDGTTNATGQSDYIIATGGTITTSGDFKIHTFTGPGTFCVSCAGTPVGSNTFDYLVVAGGAGGGGYGGGGGAGGVRASSTTYTIGCAPAAPRTACVAAISSAAQPYPITVGAGGAGSTAPNYECGGAGGNSTFSTITSAGGGGGGKYSNPAGTDGNSGGSGGGGGNSESAPGRSGGAGNTPPVSPPQGNPGGNTTGPQPAPYPGTGGGGGLMAAGAAGGTGGGGNGGAGGGFPNAFGTSGENCGSYYYFGGGGGGKGTAPGPGSDQGTGGLGGGADGRTSPGSGCSATANTGGGGGGGLNVANSGGSGIVIIRYKFQN
jgi:hypothetical protein